MGAVSSILSPEEFVTMGKTLKEEYEVLVKQNCTDEEIQKKLTEKYELLLKAKGSSQEPVVANVIEDENFPAGENKTDPTEEVLPLDEVVAAEPEALAAVDAIVESHESEGKGKTVKRGEKAKAARRRRGTFDN